MIAWRKSDRGAEVPKWLDGCRDVQQRGDLVWVGSGLVLPQVDAADWCDVSDGWQAAECGGGATIPTMLFRDSAKAWANYWEVEDIDCRIWRIPVLVSQDGVVACNRRNRLLSDGTWVKVARDERTQRALDYAQRVRGEPIGQIGEEDMLAGMVSVLEACYHLDALTIGRLAMIDQTLLIHGSAALAGLQESTEAAE